jgi:hypothetical protein
MGARDELEDDAELEGVVRAMLATACRSAAGCARAKDGARSWRRHLRSSGSPGRGRRLPHLYPHPRAGPGQSRRSAAPGAGGRHRAARTVAGFRRGRGGDAVADPYFGDEAGFETTWNDVAAAAEALVAMLGTDGRTGSDRARFGSLTCGCGFLKVREGLLMHCRQSSSLAPGPPRDKARKRDFTDHARPDRSASYRPSRALPPRRGHAPGGLWLRGAGRGLRSRQK